MAVCLSPAWRGGRGTSETPCRVHGARGPHGSGGLAGRLLHMQSWLLLRLEGLAPWSATWKEKVCALTSEESGKYPLRDGAVSVRRSLSHLPAYVLGREGKDDSWTVSTEVAELRVYASGLPSWKSGRSQAGPRARPCLQGPRGDSRGLSKLASPPAHTKADPSRDGRPAQGNTDAPAPSRTSPRG